MGVVLSNELYVSRFCTFIDYSALSSILKTKTIPYKKCYPTPAGLPQALLYIGAHYIPCSYTTARYAYITQNDVQECYIVGMCNIG